MATDEEIMLAWGGEIGGKNGRAAIVKFYRLAENEGRKAGIAEIEKELLSDATIEAAVKIFGFGRNSKAGTITLRAIMGEAIYMAKGKMGKRDGKGSSDAPSQ